MPKFKFDSDGDFSGVDAAEPLDGFYDGPVPPRGLYHFKVKRLQLKENRSENPMLNGILEIDEPAKSDKARYNGYGVWFNQNVTEQGAPYVNAFLDSCGINRKAFWGDGGVVTEEEDLPSPVKKIGGKSAENLTAIATTKRTAWPKGSGDFRLEVVSFITPDSASGGSDEPDDEPEDDLDVPEVDTSAAKRAKARPRSEDDDDEAPVKPPRKPRRVEVEDDDPDADPF